MPKPAENICWINLFIYQECKTFSGCNEGNRYLLKQPLYGDKIAEDESGVISIKGLDKAEVLAALYNAASPQRLGFLQFDPKPMTREEAREIIDSQTYCYKDYKGEHRFLAFDYLKGRLMKVNLEYDTLNPIGYDRGNGKGVAKRVIEELRSNRGVNSVYIKKKHLEGTLEAAEVTRDEMTGKTAIEKSGDTVTVTLGLDGLKDTLRPKVDKALEGAKEQLKRIKSG